MRPERKVCQVCGREFLDKHIWDTTKEYCCLLCADYAESQKTGRKPMASLEWIKANAKPLLLPQINISGS